MVVQDFENKLAEPWKPDHWLVLNLTWPPLFFTCFFCCFYGCKHHTPLHCKGYALLQFESRKCCLWPGGNSVQCSFLSSWPCSYKSVLFGAGHQGDFLSYCLIKLDSNCAEYQMWAWSRVICQCSASDMDGLKSKPNLEIQCSHFIALHVDVFPWFFFQVFCGRYWTSEHNPSQLLVSVKPGGICSVIKMLILSYQVINLNYTTSTPTHSAAAHCNQFTVHWAKDCSSHIFRS